MIGRWNLPERREQALQRVMKRRQTYLPTPEEIKRLCEEIQSSWTDQEREIRWLWARSIGYSRDVCSRRQPYEFPRYHGRAA